MLFGDCKTWVGLMKCTVVSWKEWETNNIRVGKITRQGQNSGFQLCLHN